MTRFLPRRGFCVANVLKIHVRPSVVVCVLTDFRSFHRSQRARVTWFFRPYTSAGGKSAIFGPSILAQMVWNAYQAFLKRFLKNKILSFSYSSQKSRLIHSDTKGVLVDTEKTLIISLFWLIWRLSDPSDVGLTSPSSDSWTFATQESQRGHPCPAGVI